MQNWVYFVLIAEGIWSICMLIDKFAISKQHIKNPLVFIILNGAMNVLIIFLLPFFSFASLKFNDILVALASGIFLSLAVIVYYKAIQYEEISRIAILFQLGPIFALILSYFLIGEILTKNHLIGFFFLLGAGLIFSYKKTEVSFKISTAFYLMAFSMLLGTIGAIAAKYIYSITDFWNAFLWLRISGFTALLVLLLPSVRKELVTTFRQTSPKIKRLMLLKMVIDFSAFVFAGYALKNSPVSLVTALSSSVLPLFVFVLILITSIYIPSIVKEEIDKKAILTKLLAIVLIILGIIFVNI
ncbi:DMT family transporter [Candidatus Woesearchaeota archaeon]|nr:DMT family transporter [Candidatus Woesearchaeota archaeon]